MNKQMMEYLDKNLTDNQKMDLLTDSNFMGDDNVLMVNNFDEIFRYTEPLKVAFKIYYGDFNPNHDYFVFDGYGNLVSFEDDSDVLDEKWYPELLEENEDKIKEFDSIANLLEALDLVEDM